GRPSTSKFQWFLWLVVLVFSYTAIWAARALGQIGSQAVSDIPANVLTVLGLSSATMAVAKGVTSAYVASGQLNKSDKPAAQGQSLDAAKKEKESAKNLLTDDDADPDLSKTQLLAFTVIAVLVYVVAV